MSRRHAETTDKSQPQSHNGTSFTHHIHLSPTPRKNYNNKTVKREEQVTIHQHLKHLVLKLIGAGQWATSERFNTTAALTLTRTCKTLLMLL